MSENDDITVLHEENENHSTALRVGGGSGHLQPQFHMMSGASPPINAASYHALNKAYSDLKKRYNSLDHKYSSLKKSWLDSQYHMQQSAEGQAGMDLATVCGPPLSDSRGVGVPAYGSAPQMNSRSVTRVNLLEREIITLKADYSLKLEEIRQLKQILEKRNIDVKCYKEQIENIDKEKRQLKEYAYHLEKEKEKLSRILPNSVSPVTLTYPMSPQSSENPDEGSLSDIEAVKLELKKYKSEQSGLMGLVKKQGDMIKSLLNQAQHKAASVKGSVDSARGYMISESNKVSKARSDIVTSRSPRNTSGIILHDQDGRRLPLPRQISQRHADDSARQISQRHADDSARQISQRHADDSARQISQRHADDSTRQISQRHADDSARQISQRHADDSSRQISQRHADDSARQISQRHADDSSNKISPQVTCAANAQIRARSFSDFQDTEVFTEASTSTKDGIPTIEEGRVFNGMSTGESDFIMERGEPVGGETGGEDRTQESSLSSDSPEEGLPKSMPRRYDRSSFFSVDSEEKIKDYDDGLTHVAATRSKSTSSLPASRPKELSPPMQNCPSCKEDFPHIGVSDFQQHVLECMEKHEAMSYIRPTTPGAESKVYNNSNTGHFNDLQIPVVENRRKLEATDHVPKKLNIDRNEWGESTSSGSDHHPFLNLSTNVRNIHVRTPSRSPTNDFMKNDSILVDKIAQMNKFQENTPGPHSGSETVERSCPVCCQEFPQTSTETEMQAHVLDCSDNSAVHQDRVCPMCSRHFPHSVPEETFVQHVNSHFDNENIGDYEVLDFS